MSDLAGNACVTEYGGVLDPAAALTSDARILVPAARQDVIDKDRALSTEFRLVVEGANMPTTPSALEILHARGVTVVPDFIANAGGMVAAAHSMDARYSPFSVRPEDVFAMISAKMRQNTLMVVTAACLRNQTTHAAARRLAQESVRGAVIRRGQIPAEAR